jgi:hypothetical protein
VATQRADFLDQFGGSSHEAFIEFWFFLEPSQWAAVVLRRSNQ